MSPTVPLSFFVDAETMEPSPSAEPTVDPLEALMDAKEMTSMELAAQLRAQLEDCRPLSAMEIAREQRIVEEIKAIELATRMQRGEAGIRAKPSRPLGEEVAAPILLRRKSEWRPRTDWAKEYQRLNHYPYPPEFYAFTCRAKTRAGTPCKLRPFHPNGRCNFHGGPSTGPKTEQGRRQSAENGKKGGRPRKRVGSQEPKT